MRRTLEMLIVLVEVFKAEFPHLDFNWPPSFDSKLQARVLPKQYKLYNKLRTESIINYNCFAYVDRRLYSCRSSRKYYERNKISKK